MASALASSMVKRKARRAWALHRSLRDIVQKSIIVLLCGDLETGAAARWSRTFFGLLQISKTRQHTHVRCSSIGSDTNTHRDRKRERAMVEFAHCTAFVCYHHSSLLEL